jgi:hypothetical protein
MSTIVNAPLKSKSGFESPSFAVDPSGNITAKSLILEGAEAGAAADFTFTEVDGDFRTVAGNGTDNPALTMYRNTSKSIDLTLSTLTFSIFSSVVGTLTLYNEGLRHSDSSTGSAAQGKSSGRLTFNMASDAPDQLYYGNAAGTIYGTITVLDPVGLYGSIAVTNTTSASSSLTGAVTVAGGVGIAGDLYVGGSLNIDGLGITSIGSPTDLDITAANKIFVRIDGNSIGTIGLTGSTLPVVNTTINNTVIGATTPNTAIFTAATIAALPATASAVTNKQYVDSTALSLSIAFGL